MYRKMKTTVSQHSTTCIVLSSSFSFKSETAEFKTSMEQPVQSFTTFNYIIYGRTPLEVTF